MNPPMSMPPSLWQEARNTDGRVYYYNVQTKATQWNKPFELMTPVERALANQPWKEYTAQGGRKYWYNTESKQSSWDMPEVYKNALAQGERMQQQPPPHAQPPMPGLQPPTQPAMMGSPMPPAAPAGIVSGPAFVAGGSPAFSRPYPFREREEFPRKPSGFGADVNAMIPSPITMTLNSRQEPEYASSEEAEGVFIRMLRRYNIPATSSWEQVVPTVIKDPQYRSVKNPRDRRAAFEKYVMEVRVEEKGKEEKRLAKLRGDFEKMLRTHPEIKHYSRWKTIRPIIEGETTFRSTDNEDERRHLFRGYTAQLRKEHLDAEAAMHKTAVEELTQLLHVLIPEPYVRWSEAQETLTNSEKMQNDEKLKVLTNGEILTAYEGHIKTLERDFHSRRQRQKLDKARKERKNREAFLDLLQELRAQGRIKAGSKWADTLPLFENDPRYVAMLGQAGSSPLDLFWDILEEEERAIRGPRNDVLDALEAQRYEITPQTTFEEFQAIMLSDRRASQIAPELLELVFSRLKDKVVRRAEEEKHAATRHQRRTIDALRSRIKHLHPPVEVTDTWEAVRPRVENSEEFKELETDEVRRIAFDKVIRRLKEREEEDRERRNREKERSKDRSRRRHEPTTLEYIGSPISATATTAARPRADSVEPADSYEIDRRKAQADRERNYRSRDGLDARSRYRERERERDHRRDRDRERERERERDRLERDREDRRSHRRRRLSRDDYDYDYDYEDERSWDRSREAARRDSSSYYRGGGGGGGGRRSVSASVRDFRRGSLQAPPPSRVYDRDDRLYSTRADPSSHVDELDYGGDSSATTATTTPLATDARGARKESGGLALPASYDQKRRRGTDANTNGAGTGNHTADANGDAAGGDEQTPTKKRRGLDGEKGITTATPAAAAAVAEDRAVHSGSEEGEIED